MDHWVTIAYSSSNWSTQIRLYTNVYTIRSSSCFWQRTLISLAYLRINSMHKIFQLKLTCFCLCFCFIPHIWHPTSEPHETFAHMAVTMRFSPQIEFHPTSNYLYCKRLLISFSENPKLICSQFITDRR